MVLTLFLASSTTIVTSRPGIAGYQDIDKLVCRFISNKIELYWYSLPIFHIYLGSDYAIYYIIDSNVFCSDNLFWFDHSYTFQSSFSF